VNERKELSEELRRGGRPRWLHGLAAATLIVVLVMAAFLGGALVQGAAEVAERSVSPDQTVVREGPAVVIAIRHLAQLETASFHMERVIELKEKQWADIVDLGIEDAILLVAAADVRAGVDLGRLGPDDVTADRETGKVRLTLPAVEILSTQLDDLRTYVYSRSTDLLARRSEDLETRARRRAAETLRQAALDAGILDHGRRSAERTLEALLRSLGYTDVELSWKE